MKGSIRAKSTVLALNDPQDQIDHIWTGLIVSSTKNLKLSKASDDKTPDLEFVST